MIKLESLNRREAVRYMGGAGVEMNPAMERLMDDCEARLIQTVRPKYLYKIIDLPNGELTLGCDIKKHLEGCSKAALICATLGAEADKLIRVAQISDMASAVVLDSMASVAIEQVCRQVDGLIAELFPESYLTFRFSPGYGDYPIELQKTFLLILDAPRKIGLSASENSLLIPSKSVTAIAVISYKPKEKKRRGCAVCSLRETCRYRRNGDHCGY